jgi:hypothetical protein
MPAATPAAAAQAAAEAIEAVDAEVGGTVTTDGVLVVNHANGTAWFTITALPGGERFRVTVAREIAELPRSTPPTPRAAPLAASAASSSETITNRTDKT